MKNLFILLAISILIMPSCRYRNRHHVSGDGPTHTETRNLTGFTGVESRGSIDLEVSQGDYLVRVEADQNLLQYIETVVENGRLVVQFKDGISIGDYHTAKLYVRSPEFSVIEARGSGNIKGNGSISNKNKMDVTVDGSGEMELSVDCPTIITHTNGSGDINLRGETRNLEAGVGGSGNVLLSDLKAENVKVSIHGSGNVEVYASEMLDATISGSGNVSYKGSPKITTTVHGSGEVSKMDD